MNWFEVTEHDEERIAAFMARVAALPVRRAMGDPLQIWWKAQMLRRWDAERKVVAPIDFMQPVELLAGAACLAFLLYRALPYLF